MGERSVSFQIGGAFSDTSNSTNHSKVLFPYAIVLARALTADAEALAILTKAIAPGSGLVSGQVAQCKVYLARVLRRLGEDQEAETL